VPPRIAEEEVRSDADAMNFVALHTRMRPMAGIQNSEK
jgi:hypothetical protein